MDKTFKPFYVGHLPFNRAVLSEYDQNIVEDTVKQWTKEFGIQSRSFGTVVTVYTNFCSFQSPAQKSIKLIAEYLAWFFMLNDFPNNSDKLALLHDVREALQFSHSGDGLKDLHSPNAHPLLLATYCLRNNILSSLGGNDFSRLACRLDDLIASFCWEVGQVGNVPDTDIYYQYRQHTIAVYPYLEIWRLGEGVFPEDILWYDIVELEHLNVKIMYLTNDIMSIEREVKKGKTNLLFCLARDYGISLEEASEIAKSELNTTINRFLKRSKCLEKSREISPTVKRYVDFLGTSLEGNRASLETLKIRYQNIKAQDRSTVKTAIS